MPRFLSPEWIDAVDEAVREDHDLKDAFGDAAMTIQQVVMGCPDGDIEYHFVIDGGSVAARAGRADSPTVTFTVDHETAEGISKGTASAQAGFMTGRLRLDGDVSALLRHQQAFEALNDVLAALRADTDFGEARSGEPG